MFTLECEGAEGADLTWKHNGVLLVVSLFPDKKYFNFYPTNPPPPKNSRRAEIVLEQKDLEEFPSDVGSPFSQKPLGKANIPVAYTKTVHAFYTASFHFSPLFYCHIRRFYLSQVVQSISWSRPLF